MEPKAITDDDAKQAIARLTSVFGEPPSFSFADADPRVYLDEFRAALSYMSPVQLKTAVSVAIKVCRKHPTIAELREFAGPRMDTVEREPRREPTPEEREMWRERMKSLREVVAKAMRAR